MMLTVIPDDTHIMLFLTYCCVKAGNCGAVKSFTTSTKYQSYSLLVAPLLQCLPYSNHATGPGGLNGSLLFLFSSLIVYNVIVCAI